MRLSNCQLILYVRVLKATKVISKPFSLLAIFLVYYIDLKIHEIRKETFDVWKDWIGRDCNTLFNVEKIVQNKIKIMHNTI